MFRPLSLHGGLRLAPVPFCLLFCLLFCLAPAQAAAQDWPQWRGPNHDGSTTAQRLPTDFDQEQGVQWAADLPGPGAATPIVFGDRIYLSAAMPEADELLALCLDRHTGEVLWEKSAGSGYQPGGKGSVTGLHGRSNYASPSAVTDGERVVFFFGNGDLVAFDPEGERLWARNLQKDLGDFAFQWTFSASPMLYDGKLFVQILQRDEPANGLGKPGQVSILLAMDPGNGETLYSHERPSDAQKESLESYATPIPYEGEGGRKELLVVGGDVITGHDPETGEERWRWGAWNEGHREMWWRLVPSVVVGGGKALVCAPKGAPVYAIPLGGTGTLDSAAYAWKSEGRANPVTSDVPTPLFYQSRFFVLSDLRSALSRVHPDTGEVEWTTKMPGRSRWRASPTGADGRIWCMNHAGEVVIVNADDGEIVNTIPMGEEDDDGIRSTLVVAYDRLFIRTHTKLFCVGG